MSVLYSEKQRFIIREISNEQICSYLDPVLSIIVKLINTENESFVQLIGEQSTLTNEIKKIIEFLDIRVAFFKSYIQHPIVQSKYSYYNTFEAFLICRLIRDFSLLGNDYTINERLIFVKSGEELLYQSMKQLRIQYKQQPISQLASYSQLIEDVYDNYLSSHKGLFLQDKFHLNFVNIKSSFYDFKVYNDSYVLEISERNLILSQLIQNKDDIFITDLILCDYYPSYLEFKQAYFTNKLHKYLVLVPNVFDQQEIDSFYSLQNILIICNVSLKHLRELSFLFALKVCQSAKDVQDLFGIPSPQTQNKFQLKLLYRQNVEFNRSSSELFHLKNRIPLLISSINQQNNQKKFMLSTVISVPSSLSHKQQAISQRIQKQFSKLVNILKTEKMAKGRGQFEKQIANKMKQYVHNNPYISILCQCLYDYYFYLQQQQQRIQDTQDVIFYDDYSAKKRIIKKANQLLKQSILSKIEIQFQVQKKNTNDNGQIQ